MNKLSISVLENLFEDKNTTIGNVALLGETGSGKTELLKQMIGALLSSNKKVLWFTSGSEKDESKIVDKWNGYRINNREQLNAEVLDNNSFVFIETTAVDFVFLKDYLIENKSSWFIVHEDIDSLVVNYEHNSFITEKLDFLFYMAEMGRAFSAYTLVSGEDIKLISDLLPSYKLVTNSKNLLLLKQSFRSLKFIMKNNWITDTQYIQLKDMGKNEAIFLKR